MHRSVPGTMVCPQFIGRQISLAALIACIDRLQSGQGGTALVSGEAGIGKSRLVSEATTSAAPHDVLIFQGNCFATDRASPYAPLLDLFRRSIVRQTALPITEAEQPLFADLARLLPDLAWRFLDVAQTSSALLADPEQEKRRFFANLTHFFLMHATQQPVLVVLEDLHWCDDLSLEWLLTLARHTLQAPILLLITYRSDEVSPALRPWLEQLDRERLAQECALRRLSRAEVAAMVGALLASDAVEADLLDTLSARSEGNPFFVEELLKSLVTAGSVACDDGIWQRTTHQLPIPRSVQEAVQQRMTLLSADAKQFATLAAIAGRRFNVTMLKAAMHCDEEQLLLLLKEMMAAQLVVEEELDRFAFRHALTQEAIRAALLLREQQELHRRLVAALEQLAVTSAAQREVYLEDLALPKARKGAVP